MNITFFIGNGFDINIGLATRYSQFYPYFIKNANDNNMIKSWINGNEKLWSDLEEKLGQEIGKIPEGELDKFYNDKDELDRLLIEYLEQEQAKYGFEDSETIKKEFSKSMLNFYSELPVEDVASIKKTMDVYKDEDFEYSYITFNYTNILDRIVGLYDGKATDADHVLKQNKTYDTWQEGFLAIFHLLKKDEPFVVNIYHNAPRGYIYRYLYKVTYQLIYDVLEEKAEGMVVREEDKTFIADFYKYGFVGLVLEWIDKGMKEDPKQIIERLNALIQGSFAHALNNAKLNKS